MARESVPSALTSALKGINVPRSDKPDKKNEPTVKMIIQETNKMSMLDSSEEDKSSVPKDEKDPETVQTTYEHVGLRIEKSLFQYSKLKIVQNGSNQKIFFNGLIHDFLKENKKPDINDIMQINYGFREKQSCTIDIESENFKNLKEFERRTGIKRMYLVNYLIYQMMQHDDNNPLA